MSYREEVLADNPVGYWRFGETSGTVAQDETANNLDGTYGNAPSLGVTGAISGNTAVGLAAGSQQYVMIPDSDLLNISWFSSLNFTDLRHSCATTLALLGVHPKTAQRIMGHSSIAVTLQVYTHALDEMQEDAADRVREFLFGSASETENGGI